MEAVRVFTRYDLHKKDEDCRRVRNERAGVYTPKFEIPNCGEYLWEYFRELNEGISRVDSNGYYRYIPPSEYIAWLQLKKLEINSFEYDILHSMDVMFCDEINKDVEAHYEELKEKADFKKR